MADIALATRMQVAMTSARSAGSLGDLSSMDWLHRLLVDACLQSTTPHKLAQVRPLWLSHSDHHPFQDFATTMDVF